MSGSADVSIWKLADVSRGGGTAGISSSNAGTDGLTHHHAHLRWCGHSGLQQSRQGDVDVALKYAIAV